jgi:hypothetical protein
MGFVPGSKLIVVATDDTIVLQRVETIAGRVRMSELLEKVRSLTDRLGLKK